jgi:dihydrofolate reductase
MGGLVYTAITSLDLYVVDADGSFDWAAPDDEVHAFVNDLERPIGTYLLGRRMYDTLVYWETAHQQPGLSAVGRDYAAVWQAADKVVYSRTLEAPASARTRVEPEFEPEAVRRLVADAGHDVSIGGPTLAADALRAGIVDQIQLFLNPVVVGGGTPALPDGARLDLELVAERRFAGGVVFVDYRARR